MARPLRIEYAGACYHVMARGDRQKRIFLQGSDQPLFMETLDDACGKTGWQVHAYVLMPNHYHLLFETPEPNLVAGMRWLQGTYTTRFNWRHGLSGHLFQGRYKALVIDPGGDGYLLTVANYIHLNPVRARLVTREEPLLYRWSSAGAYLNHRKRPAWLTVDRVFGELGLDDTPTGRRTYRRYLTERAAQQATGKGQHVKEYADIRRGWYLGDEAFREEILSRVGVIRKQGTKPDSHAGDAVFEHDERSAEDLLQRDLRRMKIDIAEIRRLPWTDRRKRRLARRLRSQTTMTNAWVAGRLGGGHESTVSRAVHEQE